MTDKPGLRCEQPVGQSLREIGRHLVANGRAAVADRKRIEAVAVHDFRAAMKSWRAFLRLVEPHLPPSERGWRTEARDLARMLAGARDAQAALDALADAEEHAAAHRIPTQSWEAIRHKLEDLRAHAETASLTPSIRSRIVGAMDRAETRIERWPLDKVTFADVAEGLAAHYKRARHAIPDDWRAATVGELHELRQRVVIHRYQMEVVEPLWPRLGRSWVREAQKLRNRLGEYHDLAVLAQQTEPHRPLARQRSRLLPTIGQRQAQHVASARRIAGRLFAESPKAFRRRLEAMWKALRASR